jgi:hypothetical protein
MHWRIQRSLGRLYQAAGRRDPVGRAADRSLGQRKYQVRGDKLTRVRVYDDGAAVLRQLGLLPAPAPAGRVAE